MQVVAQMFCKLYKPKINKLKGGYSAMANLIFLSWLKDIKIHVEDQNFTQRETIQLIKDFTAKHTQDKVEFYMGMVVEDQQTLKGFVTHLKDALHSGETISKLISNFYGRAKKKNHTEDVFDDDLQILVWKITAHKPSFRMEANEQLKHQYVHKLWD